MRKQSKIERRSDYVRIQLTPEGEAFAAGALRVSNRHLDYIFKPGEVQEVVERYEWTHVLGGMKTPEGAPIFTLVDDEPAAEKAANEVKQGGDANGGL